jgi:hypothetical protein
LSTGSPCESGSQHVRSRRSGLQLPFRRPERSPPPNSRAISCVARDGACLESSLPRHSRRSAELTLSAWGQTLVRCDVTPLTDPPYASQPPPVSRPVFGEKIASVGAAATRESAWHASRILPGAMARRVQSSENESREATLLRRARKHVIRGEARQAMVALREACFASGQNPKLWALYGVQCWRVRRTQEAADALRQAIWFRQREPGDRRAAPLRALLAALEEGRSPDSVRAA